MTTPFWLSIGRKFAATCRWIQRVFAAAPPHSSTAGSQSKVLTYHSDLATPIVVQAQGHVYTFAVHASFRWESTGLEPATMRSRSHRWETRAVQALHQLVAARARSFEPHRARDLEQSINRTLTKGGPWSFGSAVTCRPYVWVELDERVREQLQVYAARRIQMECEHEVGLRRTELVAKLSQRWLRVLEDLLGSPLAGGAARLTEDRLAEVINDLLAEQGNVTDMYQKVLDDESIGGFERARAHDGLMEHLGLRSFKPRERANGHNGNSHSG